MSSQLHIAALNITTSPPSTATQYRKLLTSAFKAHSPAVLRSDWVGLLGSCRTVNDKQGNYLCGDFYKYFDLILTRDWFNLAEGKKADAADLKSLSIPENLKPHFNILPFVFFPEEHRLMFVTKDRKDTLTPAQAQRIIQVAVQAVAVDILGEEKTVEVIIEQSRQSLDAIFSIDILQSLTIEVIPPNAFSDAEKQLLRDMGDERATEKSLEIRSTHPKGLSPSKNTRSFARLALSLGSVTGKGNDLTGERKEISTAAHPNIERHQFFPNLELAIDRLIVAARAMLGKILSLDN